MAKNNNIILKATIDGEKREWKLSPEDFDRFQLYFEENELIDTSGWDISKVTLEQVAPPPRTKKTT